MQRKQAQYTRGKSTPARALSSHRKAIPSRCDLLLRALPGHRRHLLQSAHSRRTLRGVSLVSGDVVRAREVMGQGPYEGEISRYLRRSALASGLTTQVKERFCRAVFAQVLRQPVGGWQRRQIHTFLGRRPC